MPNNLLIERIRNSRFELTLNDNAAVTDTEPSVTVIGNVFNFKTKNGAYLLREQNIMFSEITVRDTYGGTGDYVASNPQSLIDKLKELNFFVGICNEQNINSNRFDQLQDGFNYSDQDGKALVVDEKLNKIVPVDLYNINKLSDLFDVEIEEAYEDQFLRFKRIDQQLYVVPSDLPVNNSKNLSAVGSYFYKDSEATSLNYSTGELILQNDSIGEGTTTASSPFGAPDIWNEDANAFDFSDLSEGDQVFFKIKLRHTTTVANQASGLNFVFINQEGSENQNIGAEINETVGTYDIEKSVSFTIRDKWRNNQSVVVYSSSAASSVTMDFFDIYVIRKSVNIIDVNTNSFKCFKTEQIRLNLATETATNGYLRISYNDSGNINSVIFDKIFSNYLKGFASVQNEKSLEIKLYNKTKNTSHSAKINSLSYTNDDNMYYKADLDAVISFGGISQLDLIEVDIDVSSSSESNASSSSKQMFIGDGLTTVFTLNEPCDNVDITVGRSYQQETIDYNFSVDQVTFDLPPESGDVIWVRKHSSSSIKEVFTAIEGQTSFLLDSTPNSTDVYVGRVYQEEKYLSNENDYQRQGNQIITQYPLSEGERLTVRKF